MLSESFLSESIVLYSRNGHGLRILLSNVSYLFLQVVPSRRFLLVLLALKIEENEKGPVKLIQQVKKSLFIFTVGVKSVPLYHFKLAYVVLHVAVKQFFETHF